MRLGSNAARAHPTEPHWYLVVLGVRPSHQGHGHGSRLVAAGLHHADRDGTASYLEASDPANVAFYQRFGFAVVDHALPLVPDGPTHIAMRRPPVR
jgi:ribosomal protein S18 acetylase RimI-like enzyme